jgi:hypothetical protein
MGKPSIIILLNSNWELSSLFLNGETDSKTRKLQEFADRVIKAIKGENDD